MATVEVQNYALRLKVTGPFTSNIPATAVSVHIDGPLNLQIEVVETLCWLAATLRKGRVATISKSIVSVEHLKTGLSGAENEMPLRHFCLHLPPLEPLDDSDLCWMPLFTNSVLATQFPARTRKEGIGLDIPPTIMATLAGIVMVADFQDGLILKGLSSALVPVRECDDGTAIQWHLFHTNAADGALDLTDPKSGKTIEVLKVKDYSTLLEKKAYLGWCKHAKILLGTQESNYNAVGWSAPSKMGTGRRPILSGFTLGLSSSGLGFFGPSAAMSFTLAKDQQTRFMNIEQQLKDRLRMAVKKPCLIFDTMTRRGWLLPITSLLLHMIHLRARELDRPVPVTDNSLPSFTSAKGDGSVGAYEVLMAHMDPNLETSWKDTLALFFTALDMALQDVIEVKKSMSQYDHSKIYGYELLDIARAENPFRFSQKTIKKCSGGWTPIVQQVGYVLFCSGIEDAIIPDEGGNTLCDYWTKVPHGQDFLAAWTPCMIESLKTSGHRSEMSHLFHDDTHQDSLYKNCNHKESHSCSHVRTYSSLLEGSKDKNHSQCPESAYNTASVLRHDGAIIIGKRTKMTKRVPPVDNDISGEKDDERNQSRHLRDFLHKTRLKRAASR